MHIFAFQLLLPLSSSSNSLSFYGVWTVPETRCVTQQDGEATDVQSRLDYIPRGAGNRRHDGGRSLAFSFKAQRYGSQCYHENNVIRTF